MNESLVKMFLLSKQAFIWQRYPISMKSYITPVDSRKEPDKVLLKMSL